MTESVTKLCAVRCFAEIAEINSKNGENVGNKSYFLPENDANSKNESELTVAVRFNQQASYLYALEPEITQDKTNLRGFMLVCNCGKEHFLPSPVILALLDEMRSPDEVTFDLCGCRHEQRFWRTRKHGMSYSYEYGVWARMIRRCYNPSDPQYKYFGKIGVKVCKSWRESFNNFLRDMGCRPSPAHKLGRRCKFFSKNGCFWTDYKAHKGVQPKQLATIDGETKLMVDWVKELSEASGYLPITIRQRIKLGWSKERILSPLNRKGRKRNGIQRERSVSVDQDGDATSAELGSHRGESGTSSGPLVGGQVLQEATGGNQDVHRPCVSERTVPVHQGEHQAGGCIIDSRAEKGIDRPDEEWPGQRQEADNPGRIDSGSGIDDAVGHNEIAVTPDQRGSDDSDERRKIDELRNIFG